MTTTESITLKITIPAAVWDDYLDPMVSGMEADIGLTGRAYRKVGKGGQFAYVVTPEQALDLAEYLDNRGGLMLCNLEPEERGAHHTAIRTAAKIRQAVRA